MPATQLRPRTAPEMMDAAFQLVREHAKSMFVLAAILVLPGVALGVANSLLFGDFFRLQASNPQQPFASIGRIFGVLFPILAVWICWFMIAFGALVSGASTAYLEGREIDPATALRAAKARAGTLVGSGLLTWLLLVVQFFACALLAAVVLGLVMAVVMFSSSALQAPNAGGVLGVILGLAMIVVVGAAGLMLTARYAALPGVVIHEQVGAIDAIRRAKTLAKGSLRRVAALLLLVGVIFLVISLCMIAIMFTLGSQILVQVVASIVNVPLYALAGAIATVLYYDLRIRAEGFDIEMLADELDALPLATPPHAPHEATS